MCNNEDLVRLKKKSHLGKEMKRPGAREMWNREGYFGPPLIHSGIQQIFIEHLLCAKHSVLGRQLCLSSWNLIVSLEKQDFFK